MKMARGTLDDFERVVFFFQWLEEFCAYQTDMRVTDECDDDERACDDEDAIAYIREEFSRFTRRPTVASCWLRIVFGYKILHDNVCDTEADTLEYSAELRALIEAAQPADPPVDVHPFTTDAFTTEPAL